MKSIPASHLRAQRAVYQQGLARIDARLAQLAREAEQLGRDRLATLGAVQCIENLLTPAAAPAPGLASTAPAATTPTAPVAGARG